jgi:transposase-like protein
MRVRSCAYPNNVVEQDHRRVKRRVNPMLGFKSFENARVVVAEIELHKRSERGNMTCGAPAEFRPVMPRCGNA